MVERPIWLIGCGNMAGAMLTGWLVAGEQSDRFHIVRPSGAPFGSDIPVQSHLPENGFGNAIVQIGFKPYMLADIAPDMRALVGPDTTIVSILAGVELATLRLALPSAGQIVRAMPNTPVALCKGVVGLIAEDRNDGQSADIAVLMGKLGLAEWIADEALFNVVTALSGSGPAFLFRFVDALAQGGESLGLESAQALRMAVETVRGAADLAGQSDVAPGALADRVASPGGSTRKGLDVLDDNDALTEMVRLTLEAATRRNREMAEEAKR